MRCFVLHILLLLMSVAVMAQTEEKVIVHLKDGQRVEYLMEEVEYVELSVPQPAAPGGVVPEVGGTVGEGIDLGLSVLWADHNLGAAEQTDLGGRFAHDASEIDAWGDGWRLPTDEEWQELYDKCEWHWTVRNGIAGRLINGQTSNAIFIPAAGIAFDDEVLVNGCIGIYWTASEPTEDTVDGKAEALGAYFDSANIYRIEYPKDNRFSVRLVRDQN